jgi:hypothetical protein
VDLQYQDQFLVTGHNYTYNIVSFSFVQEKGHPLMTLNNFN